MSNKARRLKTALRRVFKVRPRTGGTKHVALVDSPGAATDDSKTEVGSTAIQSSHSIPNLELLIERKNGPDDLDDVTCFSEKTGFSIKTEAPPSILDELGRGQSTKAPASQILDAPKDQTSSQLLQTPPRSSLARSRSVPNTPENRSSTHLRNASEGFSGVSSDDELHNPKQSALIRNSPTGVSDLFPSARGDSSPSIPDALHPESSDQNRSRSRSGSGEITLSRHSRCLIPKHSHDAQKANEAFLALKKELEKNEFTKAAQVIKQAHSEEGSLIAASPSQESALKPKQNLPSQQHTDTYEIIPAAPSGESNVATDVIDDILGITPVVSQSDSLDSQCSDGSSYSSFDMESIGEITIDSTTQRLIEMHKSYCENAKVNENHPARRKKSNMRVSSAYSPIALSKSGSSIKTETNRTLTWYDQGENLNKPFTLRTDETFEDSMSTSLEDHINQSLKMVDRFLLPFTKHGLDLEKILDSMNCGANKNEDNLPMQSMEHPMER